jgi:adenine-specific DNA-methyltransferase
VQPGERVFYTNDNARTIDNVRELLNDFPEPYRTLCLAALLVKASIHNNTSGVFKGFHKKDGIGHFGGKGENALTRIKGEIILDLPLLSDFECPVNVYQKDINELIKNSSLPEFDLVYYDPPYNQHPYGSNYFMLNIINGGKPIDIQDGVSGISKDWNKSDYNRARVAEQSMDELIKNTKAKYILISYNNEGIIGVDNFRAILSRYGNVSLHEQEYNTYRGSRNLNDRDIKVNEWLWIVEKKIV